MNWTTNNKNILVTGATDGIGKALCFDLAAQGAKLIICGRNPEKLKQLNDELNQQYPNSVLHSLNADLSLMSEAKRLVNDFLALNIPLDVLFNNAGGIFHQRELTAENLEKTFALNHMAYFIIANGLIDVLAKQKEARIINTASAAYSMAGGRLDFDNLQAEKNYNTMKQYGVSKLANILFTQQLAENITHTNIRCACFHPGFVNTPFKNGTGGLLRVFYDMASHFARKPKKGAETALWLATTQQFKNGEFYFNCKPKKLKSQAMNTEDMKKLWVLSEELIKN